MITAPTRVYHTQVILDRLKKGNANQKELADLIGKTPSDTAPFLAYLKKNGKVRRKSRGQLGRYASTWAVWELAE